MMRRCWGVAIGLLVTPAAWAQEPATRTIQVTGAGVVQTPPDVAMLNIWLRGEGTTPDAATGDLAAKQKAVAAGLAGFLGGDSDLTTGNVTVIQARGKACEDGRGYNSTPRLSAGDCTVTGYIATMQSALRTHRVDKAATAAGLASRLGASDARLDGFALSDLDGARARARAAAIGNARRQATALASGAGVRLGPIIRLSDQMGYSPDAGEVRFAASAPPPPPPPPVPPPIQIDAKPRPIETRAQVYVTYAITD